MSEAIKVGVRALRENLTSYLARAREGAEITIMSRGKPVAELRQPTPKAPHKRRFGALKGKIVIPPDFDRLPDDLIEAFERDL